MLFHLLVGGVGGVGGVVAARPVKSKLTYATLGCPVSTRGSETTSRRVTSRPIEEEKKGVRQETITQHMELLGSA